MADGGDDEHFVSALHKPAGLLPIAKHRESLLYLIETSPVTIVVGQTGSGKTTQIPQFLDQAGWTQGKMIAITQVSASQMDTSSHDYTDATYIASASSSNLCSNPRG